jgi:hypothetical protein
MKYIKNNCTRNDVVFTPPSLAGRIIAHFKPNGFILDPSAGNNAFYNHFKKYSQNYDWCEISKGKDFYLYNRKVDYIITNLPWSQFRKFLNHAMSISTNVIFLSPVNHFFTKARLRDMKEKGFEFKEILYVDSPKNFPSTGFALGAVHIAKTSMNITTNQGCKFNYLETSKK